MRNHGFALLLMLVAAPLVAAPPDAATPAGEIDVDAMARAKDVKVGEAVSAAADDAEAPPAPDGASAPQDSLEVDPATAQPPADEAAPDEAAEEAKAKEKAKEAEAEKVEDAMPPEEGTSDEPADGAATGGKRDAGEPVAAEKDSAERRRVDACVARAGALLDAAQAGDYEKATRDFDAKMRGALTVEQFRQAWESLARFGGFTARGQSHPGSHEGYVVVTIPLVFEKANLYAQVSCGSDGRIAGFYVKPLQLPAS